MVKYVGNNLLVERDEGPFVRYIDISSASILGECLAIETFIQIHKFIINWEFYLIFQHAHFECLYLGRGVVKYVGNNIFVERDEGAFVWYIDICSASILGECLAIETFILANFS